MNININYSKIDTVFNYVELSPYQKLFLYNLECELATVLKINTRLKFIKRKDKEYLLQEMECLATIVSEKDEMMRFPYFFIDFPNSEFKKYLSVEDFISRNS